MHDSDVYNVASGFEKLNIVGGGADDVFALHFETYDASLSVLLDGGAGNDHLTWDLSGQFSSTFIVDKDGMVRFNSVAIINVEDYTLTFGNGDNRIIMGEGDDSIISHGGKDKIEGGGGNDYIEELGTGFKRGQANISGGDGND